MIGAHQYGDPLAGVGRPAQPRNESYGLAVGTPNIPSLEVSFVNVDLFGIPSQHGSGSIDAPFLSNPWIARTPNPAWSIALDSVQHAGAGPTRCHGSSRYLRASDHTLPELAKGRIRATLEALSDVPISKFVLTMAGGGKSLLVNNTELCKARPRARALFEGHNGKARSVHPLVRVGCGGK